MAITDKITGYFRRYWKLGLAFGLLHPILISIYTKLPPVKLTFSTVEVNIREAISAGINTGLGNWAKGILGLEFGAPIIWSAIGGILFVVIGAMAVDALKLKAREDWHRIAQIVFAGSLLATIILTWQFKVPGLTALIYLGINSLVIGLVYGKLIGPALKAV